MSESVGDAEPGKNRCTYPGCERPSRPDPATGRPSRYCEQADSGGPVHNRANAFKARRAQAQRGGVATREDPASTAPVSMARATLEQNLADLPAKFAELRTYLDDVLTGIRAAGDVEAAGAEVEDAHREALTKITEAERRSSAAERAARLADDRAVTAEREREEADALAEEALTESARLREQTQAEIAQVRTEAERAITLVREQLEDAETEHRNQLAQRDSELEQARDAVNAAHVDVASAQAAQRGAEEAAQRDRDTAADLRSQLDQTRRDAEETRQRIQAEVDAGRESVRQAAVENATIRADLATARAEASAAQRALEVDRETLLSLNRELDRQRADARAEREALRTDHAEQLAHAQRSADERVHALTEALNVAREAASYRAQSPPTTESSITGPTARRKQGQRTERTPDET